MPDKLSADGGLTALAGFLYQTIGILGMRAGAYHLDNHTGADELEALFLLVGQSVELLYEYLDQDAAIRQPLGIDEKDKFVLVQFKFSRQLQVPKISPGELTKIIARLKKSTQRALSLGQQVSGYILISNRELAPGARKMQSVAQQGNCTRPNSEILRQLHVLSPIPQKRWEDELHQFAQTYGCVEDDIQKGINERIGSIIRQTVDMGPPSIQQEDLVEAFTGYRDAQPIAPENVAKESKKVLDNFLAHNHFMPLHMQGLVRRRILDAISRATSEHAIVIVYGDGGSGKTVALWQWMGEFFSSALPQWKGTYAAILSARDVEPDCLCNLICDWAALPEFHNWRSQRTPEHVLERLHVASPEATQPILYLNVDAIDEEQGMSDGSRKGIKQLLQWFVNEELAVQHSARRPKATLILTCREKMEIANQWLDLISPYGDTSIHLESLSVNDFSHEELRMAARIGLPGELSHRIEKALLIIEDGNSTFTDSYEAPLLQETEPFAEIVDEQILQAIHHPSLWRCLLSFQDARIQSLILDGNPASLRELAKKFIGWFCAKARHRGQPLTENEMESIITTILRECQPGQPVRHSRIEWIVAARSTGLVSENRAERLYDEALSAGLIERIDQDFWRWRHQFMSDHLIPSSTI
jgi:GTPase SAR1 family protein